MKGMGKDIYFLGFEYFVHYGFNTNIGILESYNMLKLFIHFLFLNPEENEKRKVEKQLLGGRRKWNVFWMRFKATSKQKKVKNAGRNVVNDDIANNHQRIINTTGTLPRPDTNLQDRT